MIIYWPIVPLFYMSPEKRHYLPFCFYEDSVELSPLFLFPPRDMNKVALNRCELFSNSTFSSLCALKQSGLNLHENLYHASKPYNSPILMSLPLKSNLFTFTNSRFCYA